MANNPRIEPYIRTANTLDKIGLAKQADNVEALMRVGMAMDAGQPLFNNTQEHHEYLEFLREAKKLVSSQTVNERTAGEKAFVLGEIDRYIELWSFMLEEDHKVRLARKSLPFSARFGAKSQNGGNMGQEQQIMFGTLKPVFRTLWFNAIRETLGKDARFKVQDEDANAAALAALQQHKGYLSNNSKEAADYSYRLPKYVEYEPLYELGKAILINSSPEKNPELVASVSNMALEWMQSSPVAANMAENMVSKVLESEMQSAATIETRQKIANNAKDVLSWFFNPSTNKGKSELVGMPNDTYFPEGLFNTPASLNGIEPGLLWIDDKEAEKTANRVNPEFSVLSADTMLPPSEETPFDETSGPQDETSGAESLGLEEPPVTPQPKGRKGKQPVETPVETPVEELVAPQPKGRKGKKPVDEPVQSPVGIETPADVPGVDVGMENTDISEPPTPDDESFVPADEQIVDEGQDTVDEVPSATGQESTPEEAEIERMAMGVVQEIKSIESNPDTTPEVLAIIQELKDDIVNGGDKRKYAFTIVLNSLIDSVPIADRQPNNEILQWLDSQENLDALLEKAAYIIVTALGLNPNDGEENTTLDQEEHAPGTEETKPGQYDEPEMDLGDNEPQDQVAEDTGSWVPRRPQERALKLKKLVKFLGGMGLGAAAIWGIVTQLAPAGAAREAIQTVDNPQSGYSQPMQQQPEPQYTPPVQQEPQYTPPVQQPQYTPPVQQPAPQQQVPQKEKPKTWANEYYDFGDPRR